jgi:hypothetical protein
MRGEESGGEQIRSTEDYGKRLKNFTQVRMTVTSSSRSRPCSHVCHSVATLFVYLVHAFFCSCGSSSSYGGRCWFDSLV